jgi:Fe-S oxidoreductase
VDVAKLKAEFLQHYYDANGIPLRARLIANIASVNRLGSIIPQLTNFFLSNKLIAPMLMKSIGFAPNRSMPMLYKTTLDKWFNKNRAKFNGSFPNGKVYLFNDEFTRFNDTKIGIDTILLLTKLGFEVVIPKHLQSGRTYISKGLLRKARKIANQNVALLSEMIDEEHPLVGIEPSAILSFRDEYPELVIPVLRPQAAALAQNCFTIEEFLDKAFNEGKIDRSLFTDAPAKVLYHGHCQQKSIASTEAARRILEIPTAWKVEEIPSGCCGMAGSFGYEAEHYELSMKVGELVLFPAVRKASDEVLLAASGTSCRHQIADGTGKTAVHPVSLLYQALKA